MSVMNFANDLMLDFRCLIIPRFIYAVGGDFEDGRIRNAEIRDRIRELAAEAHRLGALSTPATS